MSEYDERVREALSHPTRDARAVKDLINGLSYHNKALEAENAELREALGKLMEAFVLSDLGIADFPGHELLMERFRAAEDILSRKAKR